MQEVIKCIAEHLGIDESKVTPESHLVDDLNADPFDTIELCIAVENATGVKISESDGDNVTKVQDLIDLVEKK
jgi:acyl carrier protein|tara:strand:- start:3254 stop:3472 length:219 start_codon:yes stop_codon:yes gene_type:complete